MARVNGTLDRWIADHIFGKDLSERPEHIWLLDEDHNEAYTDFGEFHGGRVCVRCHYSYCIHCHSEPQETCVGEAYLSYTSSSYNAQNVVNQLAPFFDFELTSKRGEVQARFTSLATGEVYAVSDRQWAMAICLAAKEAWTAHEIRIGVSVPE